MKITKKLKYAEFDWNESEKAFTITEQDGNRVILNKVYAFAFMRFVIRMAQKNWLNQKTTEKNNNTVIVEEEHSGQINFEDDFHQV
jgi:hypothetical protein